MAAAESVRLVARPVTPDKSYFRFLTTKEAYFREPPFFTPPLEEPFFTPPLRARVLAAFFAEADLSAAGRAAEAAPPFFPPFFAGALLTDLPRPEPPGFFPPPVILLTVAHARASASSSGTARS